MTPEHLQMLYLMLQGAAALALLLLPSLFTALMPHPSEAQTSAGRVLLAILGRFSVLDHNSWPFAWPVIAKPAPAEEPAAVPVGACAECAGPVLHAPSCGSVPGRVEVRRMEPDTIPDLPSMRTAPRIAAPVALLFGMGLVLSAGCVSLVRPRSTTAAALKSAGGRAADLSQFAVTEEQAILDTSKTQEEARARLGAHRKAVDFCTEKVLKPATKDLHDVEASLGAEPAPANVPPPAPISSRSTP